MCDLCFTKWGVKACFIMKMYLRDCIPQKGFPKTSFTKHLTYGLSFSSPRSRRWGQVKKGKEIFYVLKHYPDI